ncbi:P83/100 family protein [Spirochaeta thermophila]|uniref:Putative antigen n=1 Tax=Winmispira thermophila (strain ATCC 49972 / DSM 6192 / RI 19.B1) TaxID=665571 RepID=E0RRG9_WINT6|nr:P83/100 family protein [Spirochaeta thermophila]ADN01670.1 putative antigen [Spirochaeta thermophila DSM 6192]
MRRITALFLGLLLAMPLAPLEVARDELEAYRDAEITFVNYEGPHEKIETIEQIRGIGIALASGRDYTTPFTADYAGKYRIIHAVDPATAVGLDADIMEILPSARVDHILNLRRIISGYLQEAYGYSPEDAATLAFFITIYNAVLRGNVTYFQEMYKPVVVRHLRADTVGLSRHYRDWPGGSQIIIPLTEGAARADITAIETGTLTGPEVIQELKIREDKAIPERKEMVEIKEKQIEEEKAALEARKQEVTEEETRLAEEKAALEAQKQTLEQEKARVEETLAQAPPGSEEERQALEEKRAVEEKEAEIARMEEETAEKEARIEEEKTEIARKEAEIEKKEEAVKREREDIARDQEKVMAQQAGAAPERVPVVEVTDPEGLMKSRFLLLDTTTYEPVAGAGLTIVGRTPVPFSGGYLVIVPRDGTTGTLTLVDARTLDILRECADPVSIQSLIEVHEGNVYAVFQKDGRWHVGRFDQNLVRLAYTREEVAPYTSFTFTPTSLFLQRPDGRIIEVSLSSLSAE